jgi:hypothetical protein
LSNTPDPTTSTTINTTTDTTIINTSNNNNYIINLINKSEYVSVSLFVCPYATIQVVIYIVAQQLKQVQLFTLLHNN